MTQPGHTKKRLRRLRTDGFIKEWGTQGRRFLIVAGATFGPYTRKETDAWLDGCEAIMDYRWAVPHTSGACPICSREMPRKTPSGQSNFKTRVRDELAEFQDRALKLRAFLATPPFDALPPDERRRLREQTSALEEYKEILEERARAMGVLQDRLR